jgi:3-hydroxyisobutyrate dehydrogenase
MSKIAFLGLGAMGSRMAANLIKAGHEVIVWNRNASKAEKLGREGASIAGTPRAASERAEIVISMVRDDYASKQVWLDPDTGALQGMTQGTLAIESSTLTVGWVKALADEMTKTNISFLDAPVAGSRPQADAAQLIYFVGGETRDVKRAERVLKAMGSTIHHAGAIGSGAVIKLMVNALFGIQLASVAELIGVAAKSGIDPTRAVEIIGATPVCSPAAKLAASAMLAENYAPMFPIELVAKDFSYAAETAKIAGSDTPLAFATQAIYAKAISAGHGKDNITGIVKLYR